MRSYQCVLTKCMIPAKTKNGPNSLLMSRSLGPSAARASATVKRRSYSARPTITPSDVVEPEAGQRPQVVDCPMPPE